MQKIAVANEGSSGSEELPEVQTKFDVSIVLNLHNEARYLRRTLRSLEEAVRYARQFDISFEIVVVLDNADGKTSALVETYDYSVFDACRILHVGNGSLGLSRNDGIEAARGEFVATADADDLVSFDYFQKLYMTARSSPPKTLVFAEYYFGFGMDCYIWKFWGHEYIGNAPFYERHPYVSRVIFRRDFLGPVRFSDVSLKSGYAYEDWHFNCECLAQGFSIAIATGAILFYRQRPGSLLRRADFETSRLIPKSRFFEPNTYLKLTWGELAGERRMQYPDKYFTLEDFYALPGLGDVVAAANRIDPAISLGILRYRSAQSNLVNVSTKARGYFELCKAVAGERYTDVVLLPFLTKGGAEKYILSVLEGLRELEPESRFLFLGGQHFEKHEWLDRLPEGSLFVDLHRLGVVDLDQKDIEHISFRLIQNLPGVRRLHVKSCEYAESLLQEYSSYLRDIPTFLYYFCEASYVHDGIRFVNGHNFNLISEVGTNFTGIISDHAGALDYIGEVIGDDVPSKTYVLYARCDLDPRERRCPSQLLNRIVWASRIDGQKRPDLLKRIAEVLAKDLPNVSIDAYGTTTYGDIGPEVFNGARNLNYRGGFDGFGDIPIDQYDAFLYTAAFDGLPNVVLEALAAGMPVVATDIGGIGEAVSSETGYLVADDPDCEILAARFVDAIKTVYADWEEACRRGENGRLLIDQRHSKVANLARISEIFGLSPPK